MVVKLTIMNTNKDIQKLKELIVHLDTLYELGEECIHPETGSIVSDKEYDILRQALYSLSPDDELFDSPTASLIDAKKHIEHHPPLTSISKASHEIKEVQLGQLLKWVNDCQESSKDPIKYVWTYKLDGIACALYYEKGKLVKAGLRPRDGIHGENITEQIGYVQGVPQKLKEPITCSVRGEVYCKISDFEEVQKELAALGEQLRANPRNHAAGGIRQFKNPEKVKLMRLSFTGYSVEGIDQPKYKTEIERSNYCKEILGIDFVKVRHFDPNDLDKIEKDAEDLDYEVDGAVISVNNLDLQEQLGRHGDKNTGNPRGKIAWKFSEEKAFPKVKEIEWSTGRTGAVKPVSVFDSVYLAGTNVSRATLHNIGFIFKNGIGVGTEIVVLKAGKIIPKVIGVNKNKKNYTSIEEVQVPKTCPSCNHNLIIEQNKDNYELVCQNKKCPAQNIQGLCHYLDVFEVMGIGESKVSSLVEGQKVKKPSDFYKLTLEDAMSCDLTKRQSLLIIAGIHMIPSPEKLEDDKLEKVIEKVRKQKKKIPLWRFFASFGMESAGKSAGKALTDHFSNLENIRKATIEELVAVDDIGEKTAEVIYNYFKENKEEIDELLEYVELELPKTGKLTGKVFVLTGGFPEGKTSLEKKIEAEGGKISSSVSKKTSYVVVGTDAGIKEKKADELGIPKLNVEQLESELL